MAHYVQPARRKSFAVACAVTLLLGLVTVVGGSAFFGIVLIGLGLVFGAVARTEVRTDDSGVYVQNPFRSRFIRWDEIEGIEHGRLPTLRLRDGRGVGLEGVEPFPQVAPTKASRGVLNRFADEVNSRRSPT